MRKAAGQAQRTGRSSKSRLFTPAPPSLEIICRNIPGYDPFLFSGESCFDPKAAQRALDFFEECLTFTAGEWMGQPFRLQPWQQAVVANLFGWKRSNGMRRYREAFIYVPRKSGKSTLAGGLGNLLTFADGEPGAQVYCAAADREQARLVFNAAKTMVLAEPELAGRSRIYTNAITVPATGSVLKVVSAEAYTKHGVNAHGVIIDELHAQPDRELVDVLTTSTGARRQPLIIYITTADYDRDSICNEKYDYAIKVRDGVIDDPAFLPVIYEASRDEEWTDPDVWAKANPNLGVSLSMEYMERECRRARETPTYENTFKRLHLNMKTQQDVRWLALEQWDASAGPPIDEEALRGRTCWAGLDLSTTTDISAFVMVFQDEDGGITVLPKFWIPAENAQKRERRDRVPYETWARQGLIEMTSGNVVDYDVIRQRINEWRDIFDIREIAIDPWNATHITSQLQSDGIPVVTFGQGFKDMTAPTKEWEKLILCRKLRHGGNPVLRWMASNVAVETDAAGNLKPSKKKSTQRIDGTVAGIMALGRAGLTDPGWDGTVAFLL
ncbi:MAG: terminase large subunit [Phycisphaerales bacterium]|nr:terminase large subunit [Phycisphaerales bacterium]